MILHAIRIHVHMHAGSAFSTLLCGMYYDSVIEDTTYFNGFFCMFTFERLSFAFRNQIENQFG